MKELTTIRRFWEKVSITPALSDCWEWAGARNSSGYGHLQANGVYVDAHRFSWELHFGRIPPGMFVCHHCDNPPCIRSSHLFLGTRADNARDMVAKGRNGNQNTGKLNCLQGHPLSGRNLYHAPNGSRGCRFCRLDAGRRFRARRG